MKYCREKVFPFLFFLLLKRKKVFNLTFWTVSDIIREKKGGRVFKSVR